MNRKLEILAILCGLLAMFGSITPVAEAQEAIKTGEITGLTVLYNTDKCGGDVICRTVYQDCGVKMDDKSYTATVRDTELKEATDKVTDLKTSIKTEGDCKLITIEAKKSPFTDVDNLLCKDGTCDDRFAWWNSTYTYRLRFSATGDIGTAKSYEGWFPIPSGEYNATYPHVDIRLVDGGVEKGLAVTDANSTHVRLLMEIDTWADDSDQYIYWGNTAVTSKPWYAPMWGMTKTFFDRWHDNSDTDYNWSRQDSSVGTWTVADLNLTLMASGGASDMNFGSNVNNAPEDDLAITVPTNYTIEAYAQDVSPQEGGYGIAFLEGLDSVDGSGCEITYTVTPAYLLYFQDDDEYKGDTISDPGDFYLKLTKLDTSYSCYYNATTRYGTYTGNSNNPRTDSGTKTHIALYTKDWATATNTTTKTFWIMGYEPSSFTIGLYANETYNLSGPGWWNTSISYKMPIHINQTGTQTLVGFDALLNGSSGLNLGGLIHAGKLDANAYCLFFVNNESASAEPIYWYFVNSTSTTWGVNTNHTLIYANVTIPTTNTTIAMYYSPDCGAPSYTPYMNSGAVLYKKTLLYDFGTESGTNTADRTNSGLTGTLVNTPAWYNGGPIGYDLDFEYTDSDYVDSADNSLTEPSVLTTCVWYKPEALASANGANSQIVNNFHFSGGQYYGYLVAMESGGNLWRFGGGLTAAGNFIQDSTHAAVANKLYHVCGRFNGSTTALFVNGTLNSSTARGTDTLRYTGVAAGLRIGTSEAGGEYADGLIDRPWVSNLSLSDSWILRDFMYDLSTTGTEEAVPDLTPPTITIANPLNATYYYPFGLNVTVNEAANSCVFNIDGGTNTSLSNSSTTNWYYSLTPPVVGTQHLIVYCNDTSNNTGMNSTIWFTYDNSTASFIIDSPENDTYYSTIPIYINVSSNKTLSNCAYDYNGTNTSFTPNTTITLTDGFYSMLIGCYYNATGEWLEDMINFTVITPPSYVENCTADVMALCNNNDLFSGILGTQWTSGTCSGDTLYLTRNCSTSWSVGNITYYCNWDKTETKMCDNGCYDGLTFYGSGCAPTDAEIVVMGAGIFFGFILIIFWIRKRG